MFALIKSFENGYDDLEQLSFEKNIYGIVRDEILHEN